MAAPGNQSGRARPATDRGSGIGAHLRRYGAFYAGAAVIALVALILPNVGGDEGTAGEGGGTGAGDPAPADGEWAPASGDIEAGTGVTRGGIECEPGVAQIPDTIFAIPCVPEFTGDNGGETYRGVTEDTIRIVMRTFPDNANSTAVRQELEDAGVATEEDRERITLEFVEYFQEHYELYGRRVELIPYESRFSNSTQEALGQGREGACQDATLIVEELEAFGVVGDLTNAGGGVSGVFTECAAERELVVFQAAAYYPESFYEDLHPFAWNTTMDCSTLQHHVVAYVGKRLMGRPAQFAADPALRDQERRFGIYSPDNPQYVQCSEEGRELFREEYGVDDIVRFRYALDFSRFAQQAEQAVLQWKADGVTTVLLSADPISIGMLTEAAQAQDYGPEWVISGTSGMDTDNLARAYQQDQADGHLFGLSQLSATSQLYGDDSEAGRLHRKLTGDEIVAGTTGNLYAVTHLFNFLQAAGPDLTPDTMAAGVQSLPELGGDGSPIWSYRGGKHTATEDSREVYWDGQAPPGPEEPDPDARGTFVATHDGRRFLPAEWPAEEPPVYPDR